MTIVDWKRKTTGSYYTPSELVNELVERALVPVLNERLATVSTVGYYTENNQSAFQQKLKRMPDTQAHFDESKHGRRLAAPEAHRSELVTGGYR